jgi:hypothetical protein
MSVYIGASRISRKNFFNRSSLTSLEVAWRNLKEFFEKGVGASAKILLVEWRGDQEVRRFTTWTELANALSLQVKTRKNYFFGLKGENENIGTVVFKTDVPTSSIGWSETKFFEELGHPRNRRSYGEQVSSRTLSDLLTIDFIKNDQELFAMVGEELRRRAEQEFLMQNMVKGALWDASEVADQFNLGISVRGTGLLAHMGIESGDPTKAQEFKNKTSKEVDLILCEELEWSQLGAVVHYDPRVNWSSRQAEIAAGTGQSPMFRNKANNYDWLIKREKITQRMKVLGPRIKLPSDDVLRATFFSRSDEYMEEDHEYRKGHYAPYTKLVGPYVRLKARSDVNMVGDHDLFAFTLPEPKNYGRFMQDTDIRVANAQKALQNKPSFQAQHGGIWYWKPSVQFNVGIKNKIMGAHGPEGDEPLVYIRPGKQVTAAYYTSHDNLASVWDNVSWTKWMKKTHSGNLYLNPVALDTE